MAIKFLVFLLILFLLEILGPKVEEWIRRKLKKRKIKKDSE